MPVKISTEGFSSITALCLLFFLTGFSAIFYPVAAQYSDSRGATLRGWENNISLFIKDRSNNFGGFYYDRGLFRMHTLPMDMEYQLDIFTYQFSYFNDYEWLNTTNGFRSYVGSLNTSNFAVQSQLKYRLEISENAALDIVAYQQDDLRAQRGSFSLDYSHRIGSNHQVGAQHMLGNIKTDLDATFYYRFGNSDQGMITTEVTVLDWANNIVSDLSDSRNSEFEVRHLYSRRPYLYTLRLASPRVWIFRGEATAAVQPRSQAEVFRRDQPGENYIFNDWVNYQAALLEAHFPGGTAGIIYQRTFARMEREPARGSDNLLEYGNRQVQKRGGVYFTYSWKGFVIEQWFWIERNSDKQFDENPDAYTAQEPQYNEGGRDPSLYPFYLNEIRRFNKTTLFYQPDERLLSFFIEHNGDWRSPDLDGHSEIPARNYRNFYPNHIMERNERLTFGVGFTFNSRSKLTLGASVDLDGDLNHGFGWERDNASYALFDGGFGRLQILW